MKIRVLPARRRARGAGHGGQLATNSVSWGSFTSPKIYVRIYIYIHIYICTWNPNGPCLLGKDLVLEGSTTKIEDKQVPGIYIYTYV